MPLKLGNPVPMPFCFSRALESPSVVQIPAALDAVGVLLYHVADCMASQGTLWGKRLPSLAHRACGRAHCSAMSFCRGVSGGILLLARIVGQTGFLLLSLCLWERRGLKVVVACFIANSFENCCDQKITAGSS